MGGEDVGEEVDLLNLGVGWSIQEAEAAAQDRTVWRILTSQAASADMHDADWQVGSR